MSTETIETTLDRATIRKRLRSTTQKEFVGAHTKALMEEMMETLGVANDLRATLKTKDDIYEALVAKAGLPDQSLRGKSSVDSPVARMWQFCDKSFAASIDKGAERPRRKDVIEAAKAAGIAHHTARTQYQSWFNATNKGTIRLADVPVADLPRVLQPEPEPTKQGEAE